MSDQKNAVDLLQGLLDEQHGRGLRKGYEQALSEVLAFIQAKLAPSDGLIPADHHGHDDDASPPTLLEMQPPSIRKAMNYLREHPGTTAHVAALHVRNKNAFYTLVRLGLADKRGSQFFAKDASDGR
jgi:hypothetical protein